MFDLANFTVGDMVVCSSDLRRRTADCPTLEEAARTVVRHLRGSFLDPHTGRPQLVLARMFQTVPRAQLPAPLRGPGTAGHCLTLLAGDGDLPEWRSREHDPRLRAIPVPHPRPGRRVGVLLERLGIPVPPGGGGDGPPGHEVVVADPATIRDREFVRRHGVRGVLAYAGDLPDGLMFTVVAFTRVEVPGEVPELFRTLAVSTRLALLPLHSRPLFTGQVPAARPAPSGRLTAARLDALEHLLSVQEDTTVEQARAAETFRGRVRSQEKQLRIKQMRLEQETRIVETLYQVGQQLTRELNMERLVQVATDAATTVIAARHGMFVYTDSDADGLVGTRYAVSGPDRGLLGALPRTGAAPPAGPVLRLEDLTTRPDRDRLVPFDPASPESPVVRSYLAAPVTSRGGENLGMFVFGHDTPGVFTERDEQLVLGIASQTASAIENARLYRSVRDTAVELQRSLLPAQPPVMHELDVAWRYLPGAKGSQVGGDWFDVIPLTAGRVALVIGDVMGRGLRAAAVMGQLRAAVRAYAVMDLPPAQVMRHLNRLLTGMADPDQITTCVYAVYDPATSAVRWANAGHLPPALVTAQGRVRLLDDELGIPLGVDGATFEDAQVPFSDGDRLLLYTDGLVESHDASLTERLRVLTRHAGHGRGGNRPGRRAARSISVDAACESLLGAMLTGREHDDVALLMVRARRAADRAATLELPPTARAAAEARAFSRATLRGWNLTAHVDAACSVVTELVSNAALHARTPMELQLRHRHGHLVVQVADHDGRLPKELMATPQDERHRGLRIVSALASDWGARHTDTGKVVWAEIADRDC